MSFLFSSGLRSTIPDSVVDDFEDGNISEYSGDTGAFSVVQDRTYDGSYALYSNATSSAVITAGTADGLNDIPKRGDTFRYSFYITTLDRDMRVFWAGGTNGYDLSWWSTNRSGIGGTWELRDGSGNVLDNNGTDAPTDKWGVVEVDFSDPIVCDVYQASEYSDGTPMVTLSTSDDSHDSGDILWYANAGSSGEQWYDAFYTT